MWLRKIRHELMDLDTTIAYDEAEQEDEPSPSNLGISPGVGDVTSSSGPTEDEISRQSDPEEDVDIVDVAVPSDDGTNSEEAINTPEGSMATGGPDQGDGVKANVGWIDHAKDLELKTLFTESPTRHIYAQTGRAVAKAKTPKKGYHPQESLSRAGRQRKVPAHLQDYTM